MTEYHFNVFADYHQFYLQDENAEGNFSESWNKQTVEDKLALVPNAFAVGTARPSTVPVTVEILESAPHDDNFDEWNQVNECSFQVPTGRIVILGCTDYFPTATRIVVKPGCYRVRIYYGGLDTLSESGLDGNDRYRIVLWIADYAEPEIFKRYSSV